MTIKVVSWDVDGTLFSYPRLFARLVRLSPLKLKRAGWKQMVTEIKGVARFHRMVEAQRRTADSRVVEEELQSYEATHEAEKQALIVTLGTMQPRRSALRVLDDLHSRGIVQVVVSDFEAEEKIQALGLSKYFSRSFSCRQLGFWKPSPFSLEHVQREFGVSPAEHLHIGDRLDTDGEACARNGCSFLHVRELKSGKGLAGRWPAFARRHVLSPHVD